MICEIGSVYDSPVGVVTRYTVHCTSFERDLSASQPGIEQENTGMMSAIGIRCPSVVIKPIRPSNNSSTGDVLD